MERQLYINLIGLARREAHSGDVALAEKFLERCPSKPRGWEWAYCKTACHDELKSVDGVKGPTAALAYSPDGQHLASAGQDGKAWVWDLGTGRQVVVLVGHEGTVEGVAYGRDGRKIATAGDDHTVRIWEGATGRELLVLRGHADLVCAVAFSPTADRVASTGTDGTACVWDASTGREAWKATGTSRRYFPYGNAITFSPDGRRVAASGEDYGLHLGVVAIRDAETGRELLTLGVVGHQSINGLAYFPDGRRIATASNDRTVKLWDANTGEEIFTLRGHGDLVTGVACRRTPEGVLTLIDRPESAIPPAP